MSFNLEPPPGFRGLDPSLPVTIYTRNLPHWRQAGATYFVTFHLADALPLAEQDELRSLRREWELRNPPPRDELAWTDYAKTVFRKVEMWMDAGYGACWFCQEAYAKEMQRALLHFHEVRYELGAFAVMANHCHLAIRPYDECDLETEIGAIKSVVAHFVRRRETLTGQLWQQESYDRIIRDAEHLYRVVQYIGDNPRRANVPRHRWRRWINPTWQTLGWNFHDPS